MVVDSSGKFVLSRIRRKALLAGPDANAIVYHKQDVQRFSFKCGRQTCCTSTGLCLMYCGRKRNQCR